MSFLPGEQGEKFKINLYDHGCGVAVGDFDGDGHDDIYFVNQLGPNALYRNKGDGTFEDVTAAGRRRRWATASASAPPSPTTTTTADQDLYVTSTRGGNVLFRNQGDGTFKDVTKEAGLTPRRPLADGRLLRLRQRRLPRPASSPTPPQWTHRRLRQGRALLRRQGRLLASWPTARRSTTSSTATTATARSPT